MNPTTNNTKLQTYDTQTIWLHWLTAIMVLGLWIVGQCIDFFPKGDARVYVRSMHILVGTMLGLLLIKRLVWRFTKGVKLPPSDAGIQGRAAIGVHHLLYTLLVAIVIIGVACVWIRGDNLFNLVKVPSISPGNKALSHDAVELHGLIANVLLFVAGLHAVAALWHQWVKKDNVMARMVPRLLKK